MNVLLVSPQTPDTFWSFKHVLRFVSKKSTFPPLGLLTVAALLPREWKLTVVDLNVARLRDEDLCRADVVMLTAMLVHEASVREIVARCTALGKRVVAGGPLFTTGHEAFPEIQHFVLGEADEHGAAAVGGQRPVLRNLPARRCPPQADIARRAG